MANTKSAIKNHRKTVARTLHNRSRKSRIKTLAKKVQLLAAEGSDKEALKSAAIEFVSAMDRAAKTNLIHANKANRAKASVAKYILG
ncbi:30S ribosomal protein S20 [Pelagicoccus sp. SDUM812003]|uniref:30S ribosomal protein S20 n=1 Tax=Pelagicoccus sp. SDUM812003 TaxID=3041267 RepID=UPI00280F5B50|nr:30S ribosomal protein S20 [Pelagicoccus sp. SDUM812003]MDQ8201655.1 30S ribosomal protein S20 [Pelagicoccus sp. SDUM812003]